LAAQSIRDHRLFDEYNRINNANFQSFNKEKMNLKRIFGALLTILGIGGLIYAAVIFVNGMGATRDTKALFIFGILGLIFFISGISLIRTTKDES